MPRVPHRAHAWLLTAGGLLSSAGCSEPDSLPHYGTLRYESENLVVWASEGLTACGGTHQYTQQWLASLRGRIPPGEDSRQHTFYWLSPEDFAQGVCGTESMGCAYTGSGIAYATIIPFEHELVHLELAPHRPPSVLSEGIAEMFGTVESYFASSSVEVMPLFEEEPLSSRNYQTAGRFSRFVADRYGLGDYLELYRRLDGTRGFDATAEVVRDQLGDDLVAVVEEFEAAPLCPIDGWRFADYECSSLPLVPWRSSTQWSEQLDLSCGAPDVIGPRFDRVWTLRALEVIVPGPYRLQVQGDDPDVLVSLFSCDDGCFGEGVPPGRWTTDVDAGGLPQIDLEVGRYWLRAENAVDREASVSVTLEWSG